MLVTASINSSQMSRNQYDFQRPPFRLGPVFVVVAEGSLGSSRVTATVKAADIVGEVVLDIIKQSIIEEATADTCLIVTDNPDQETLGVTITSHRHLVHCKDL